MEGTGSVDYAVTDLFVPEAHAMDTFSTEPTRPEPVFRLGLLGIGVGITYAGDGKGALTLKFASLDQLDMICQRLSGESI